MNLSFEIDMQVKLFSAMSSAMDEVIEGGNVDSVTASEKAHFSTKSRRGVKSR